MKCRKCSEKAVIELKSFNLALCKAHFEDFFISKTEETIRRYRLFTRKDLIVVAVSGGKDSLALWYVLNALGYRTHGLHINLGIGNYSKNSLEKTFAFSEKYSLPLSVISLKESLGFTIENYRDLGHRAACSTCGIIKRYLMNDFARKTGASCVATGHNLDDEAAVLLGNLLNWNLGYLRRQNPKLPASAGFFVSRVKPFCERAERETAAFCLLKKIDYIYEECPSSQGATSIFYKQIMNEIENRSPGTKLRFYRGFLENKPYFGTKEDVANLVPCEVCGQPTVHSPCSFCRLIQKSKVLKK